MALKELEKQIEAAKHYIKSQGATDATIGLVLGSGLGVLAEELESPIRISYEDIPYFPVSTVEGHKSELVYGTLGDKKVLAMSGRFHFYEGYSMEEVTFPIRVMKSIGIHSVIITNAAGGINESFRPGELMLITDQLNMTGTNPLIGPNNNDFGPRFVDMTQAFDLNYQNIAKETAERLEIDLKEGVYMGVSGPTYETPAEIRMFRTLGADAVGMSTVPEVIVARHCGLRVLGISCITNMGAGMQKTLDHNHIVDMIERVKTSFKQFVKEIVVAL